MPASPTVRQNRSSFVALHALEDRKLFASSAFAYDDFASLSNLNTNGFGSDAPTSGVRLRMTTNYAQGRSVWYRSPVAVETFTTSFTFQAGKTNNRADGLTFTVQSESNKVVGIAGNNLGFGGIDNSVGVAFNLFNFGHLGSTFGIAVDGERPRTNTDMGPLDLHSSHRFNATISYDGETLRTTVVDATDPSLKFTNSKVIDLEKIVGGGLAYVGFTAATGERRATQDLLKWNFSGKSDLEVGSSVTAVASANPNPVTGKTTALSVTGASGSNMKYQWKVLRQPDGARKPSFSENGSNDAQDVDATFYKDGTYIFQARVRGGSVDVMTNTVSVVVKQVATSIGIEPHKEQVPGGNTIDFSAIVYDQFKHPLRTQPGILFAIDSGPGQINTLTGEFTSRAEDKGHLVVSATALGLTGVAGGCVLI